MNRLAARQHGRGGCLRRLPQVYETLVKRPRPRLGGAATGRTGSPPPHTLTACGRSPSRIVLIAEAERVPSKLPSGLGSFAGIGGLEASLLKFCAGPAAVAQPHGRWLLLRGPGFSSGHLLPLSEPFRHQACTWYTYMHAGKNAHKISVGEKCQIKYHFGVSRGIGPL